MKFLLLVMFLLAVVLGAGVLGWFARWYRYGGRCGPDGLADGVPNIDLDRGVAHLGGGDMESPLPEVAAKVGAARDAVTEKTAAATGAVKAGASDAVASTKASLDALKDGFVTGKEAGTSDTVEGSTAARIGAVAGGAAASVAAGVARAAETVKPEAEASEQSEKSAGAVLGQEDGNAFGADTVRTADSGSDPHDLRGRFAAIAEENATSSGETGGAMAHLPEAMASEEEEARNLIEQGVTVDAPESALPAPHHGRAPDDLKRISGIGPKIEKTLNDNGVFYFEQIASFTGRDLAWADQTLGFRGRVVRDRWFSQARILSSGD